MPTNFSMRARIWAMNVGDILVIPNVEAKPSVVHATVYSVKRDAGDGRNYKSKTLDNGVEVCRVS